MRAEGAPTSIRLSVDIGGTFTDAVAVSPDGRQRVGKAPTTPGRLTEGVLDAIASIPVDPADVSGFVHGTTAGLNALLERRGARVALLTTVGFRDVYEIGRANRPAMYDLLYRQPERLVPRRDVFEVPERLSADGETLRPLDEEVVRDLARRLAGDYDAVAVVLLHAYAHDRHERRVAELLAEEAPQVLVVCSADVAPEWREYERTSTTVASAYVAPIIHEYLERLEDAMARRGFDERLRVMQSNGGIMTAPIAREKPIQTLLSGPVGGTMAAVEVAATLGLDRLVCVDMGGTSFDVSLVVDGRAEVEPHMTLQGQPLLAPSVAIHTVGAGGGSVAHVVAGALRVGPRSAGALPGPACYGRGGTEPTVTDANVVLGRLPSDARLGGGLELDAEAAAAAIDALGGDLGLGRVETAEGIVAVADAAMANAIREITVTRGIDPRDFTLLAFGGAGPLHAVALAQELGMRLVVVPANPGVLSAWGMLHSDTRHDLVQSFFRPVEELDATELADALAELAARGRRLLEQDAVATADVSLLPSADLRYAGQEYTVTAAWDPADPATAVVASLPERLDAAHLERYGHNNVGERVECVNLRMTAVGRVTRQPAPEPAGGSSTGPVGSTRARLAGAWHAAPVHARDHLRAGGRLRGPAVVLEDACTTLLPPGWTATVTAGGSLRIEAVQA